jgi:hypothetical protein
MSASSTNAPPRPGRRRWFQYGIRSLLLLMLACGLLFAYAAHVRREQERERPAIAAVEEIGGTCETAARGPAWVRWLAGEKATTRVVSVDLTHGITASGIGPDGVCISINPLRQSVTDDWLAKLEGLKQLETLSLSGNPITGEGLSKLRHFPRLKVLDLSRCEIDDQALAHVGALRQLRSLDISDTKVRGEGLEHLSGLTGLVEIEIGFEGSMTEASLQHLRHLPQIEKLHLSDLAISDAGIELLEALPNLTELDLGNSRLLKSGFERIGSLTKLQVLHLSEWSQEAELPEAARLAAACPHLKIEGGPLAAREGAMEDDDAPLPPRRPSPLDLLPSRADPPPEP